MAQKNNNGGFIVIMMVLIIMLIAEVRRYVNNKELIKNNVITSAEIYRYESGGKNSSAKISYEFFVNDKKYTGSFEPEYLCMSFSIKNKRLLAWSKICIIYNHDNPNVSKVFMKHTDERKYSKKIPSEYLETRRKFFCQ